MIDLKKDKKEILQIIFFTITLIFMFVNISTIWTWIKYIISIFMPFIIGVIIAFILNVLLNVVEEKLFRKLNKKNSKTWKKIRRPVSIAITLIIIIGIFVLLLGLVIPQLKNTTELFTKNFSSYKEQSVELLGKVGLKEKEVKKINKEIANIKKEITNYITNNKEEVMQTTVGVASSLIGMITSIILGIVFAVYILLKKEDLTRQSKKIMKAYLPEKQEKRIGEIASLSKKTFGNFISVQCLEALILGVLCFLGMLILKLPYASTISVLIGFTAIIPVFGAFIGIVLGAFLIFMINPTKALIFVIFILLLQQVEGNFIYPKVVGKSVGLPSLWVMVAVTVGGGIAGILGMLISVPLCSIIYSIIKTDVNDKLKKQAKNNKKGLEKSNQL